MKYIIICLVAISSIANAATRTYIGGIGGIWNATGSWQENFIPTNADDVTIASGTCVVGTGVTAVCKSLTLSGAANLTLQSATALSVTNSFTMTSTGTLTVGSASSANLVPFPTCGSVSLTNGAVLYTANNVSQIINTSITYFNLTLAKTSKTVSSTLNISSNLSVGTGISLTTSSTLNVGSAISGVGSLALSSGATLDVKGSVTITTMTCDANSTVIYSGTGTQTAKVTAYGTLRKSPNSNNVNIAAGFSAATLEVLTGTLSMASGSVSGAVQVNNGATLSISTSFPTYGTTSLGASSTVTYTGSSGFIESLTYGNLTLAASATKAAGVGNITTLGNFTLGASATILLNSSGVLEVQGNVIGSSTSTLGVADGYLLLLGSLASAINMPVTSGTVEYGSSSTSQVIQAKQYHNLILSGSSNKTLSSSATIQLTGDLTNSTSGTITSTSTTIEFNSSSSGQSIPAFKFYNLKISESDKVLSGDVIVTNSLDLNGTFITTGSNSVRILNTSNAAITILDPSTSYITGILARNFANGTSTLPYPLGENNQALPVAATLVLTSGGGTSSSNGYLAINSTLTDPASYPSFDDANFRSTTNVCNRYWTVQNIGYTYSDLQIGMRFLNPDDIGVDVSDATVFLGKIYDGSAWSDVTVSDPQADTSTVTGLTIPTTGNSIDIWLGEESGGLCQSTGTGLNWNSAATWSCGRIPIASDTVEILTGHTITLDGTGHALGLSISGTAIGVTATDVIIGTGGVTLSSTGTLLRTSGNPNLATSGNLTINNSTTIPTEFVLELTGNNKFILTDQTSLSIPRLTISASSIGNFVPNLTIGTDLGSASATNTLVQQAGTTLTISDGFTFITIDASATGASVIYDRGFTTQTVNRGTYYDLTLTSNAVTTKITSLPDANVTVTNSLTLQKGSATTHSLNITSTLSSLTGTGATFTMRAGAVVNVGATSSATSISFPSTFTTYTFDPTSTVSYNTNGNQPVAGITGYSNLVITTGTANANKTLAAGATTTNLTLTNGAGTATFSLGTSILGLSGTISGTGTLSCPDGSTFNYNSNSATQTVLAHQYANLSFTNAGTKNLPTSGVLVSGNLTSNSSLSVPTNSLLTLNGTSGDQAVNTNLSFYDLLKSGAATVSFASSNTTVTNSFVVQDGSGLISPSGLLTIADGAYLMDNSAGSSSFASGSSGNVTIKKAATSGAKRAYLLSGSTTAFTETELKSGQTYQVLRYETDATPNNISSNFTRSCDGGTAHGSINGLYLNTTGTLTPGRGYSVTQNAGTKTITLVGNPNFGSISVNSLLTASIDRESATYNWCPINNRLAILGNPYPTSIDWAAVLASSTNLNTTCKIWNGTNYTDLVSTGTIPTGQGFFVRVLTSPGTLTFNNSHRLSSSTSLLRSQGKTLALALTAANEEFSDVLTVNFNNDASENLDSKYDSYDLPGIEDVPCFSSIVNGQQLSTNQLPEPKDDKIIPVYIKAPYTGSYSLSVKEYNLTDKNLTAYFVDKKEQKYSDLSQANTVEIDLDKGESNDRFEIQFRTSESAAVIFSDYNSNNKLYATEEAGNLIVSYNDDIKSGSIFVYDINGRLISKQTDITSNSGRYNMLSNISNSQCYVIKLVGDSKTRTLKFIR